MKRRTEFLLGLMLAGIPSIAALFVGGLFFGGIIFFDEFNKTGRFDTAFAACASVGLVIGLFCFHITYAAAIGQFLRFFSTRYPVYTFLCGALLGLSLNFTYFLIGFLNAEEQSLIHWILFPFSGGVFCTIIASASKEPFFKANNSSEEEQ